jgi:hypothetical protein
MLLSHHQNEHQNLDMKVAWFENLSLFIYLGMTGTNQNLICDINGGTKTEGV